MTLKQYLYDDIAESTAATTGNTGALQVNTSGGGSITALAAAAAQGARGLRLVSSTTAATSIRNAPLASSKTMARTTEITTPSPTGTNKPTIWSLRASTGASTTPLRLLASASGSNILLELQPITGGNISLGTSYTPATKYRVACWVVVGSATTSPYDGVLHFRVYPKGSTTAISAGTVDLTNVNLGVAVIDQGDFGVTAAIAESYTMDFDSDQWDDGRTSEIPQVAPGIVGSASTTPLSGAAPLNVTTTVTASGGTGTPYSYLFTWGDGTTTTSGSASATHTYTAAGSYVTSVTVSNT